LREQNLVEKEHYSDSSHGFRCTFIQLYIFIVQIVKVLYLANKELSAIVLE